MKLSVSIAIAFTLIACDSGVADESTRAVVLLQDSFDREESDPAKEEIGNDWGTNSAWRAKGQKQVDLKDGAMHITRAAIADHGVSVFHDVAFRNATIELRFKLGEKDDLGINIADMQEKSVHAGHICMARIRLDKVEIADLKIGRMKLEVRNLKQSGKKLPAALQKHVNSKSKIFPAKLKADEWHHLAVKIQDDSMTVTINEKVIGRFQSEGIGHPTKRRLRLAVGKSAWVDDVKITGR